jgi:hypothetical protein
MPLSEADIFNLQMRLVAADPNEVPSLRALATGALAEENARLIRLRVRQWTFNAIVGFGFLFIMFVTMLAAIRLVDGISPVLAIALACVVVWAVVWLFNTHDRLNSMSHDFSATVAQVRLRREALERCVSSANRYP